ncbi:epimerase [Methylobacterium sp. Leaf111]|uniref:GDP-mannose 4,6-dehydratase n=1 Tax=Methylobacterium sp. Leaf111 TaxID=1736257 RepID=UPI0006FF9039|nr:GDP-mannose 4,6-dehydratase [Methylobacterium sp. Leaf111]KQP58228.1 epimerase [Methylobacterium sp. Leaf111]
MKRILVTGAGGFVGKHAITALAVAADSSDRIVGIGRGKSLALPSGATFRSLDLLDQSALSDFISVYQPTDILHLAAIASVQQSAHAPGETWRVNLVGLLNLAEAVIRFAPDATLFFVSSGEVYGRAFLSRQALTEEAIPEPQGAYACSKWFGETLLGDVMKGGRYLVLRPFNHIGPGQDERFVVPSFAGQIARIEAGLVPPVLEVGNLDAARDFLPVSDVVRAYASLIVQGSEIESGTVFNVASGQPRTIASVLEDMRRHARVPLEVRVAPHRMRPSEIPIAAGDASRLSAATGWAPREDWDRTLSDILAHARTNLRG